MGVFNLPKLIVKQLDKRRRCFFWLDNDTCSGAKCLVAWDRVCFPKLAGGLGVKNIQVQNVCLLLKFANKFLHSPPTLEELDSTPVTLPSELGKQCFIFS